MGVLKAKIPYEIKEYEGKFIFGLTLRQIICVGCIAALTIPTGIIGYTFFNLSIDTLGYILMAEVAPFAAIGWLKYNGMPLEKAGKILFLQYFGQQKRKWAFKTPERVVAEILADLRYIDLAICRAEELDNERIRAKEERKNKKKNKKISRKRKGSENDAESE